jgi:hypothetical protein
MIRYQIILNIFILKKAVFCALVWEKGGSGLNFYMDTQVRKLILITSP